MLIYFLNNNASLIDLLIGMSGSLSGMYEA